MKTLGLTLVFAASSLVNGLAGNVESKFAYNVEKNGEQITSQTVYQVEEGKYLKQHLQDWNLMVSHDTWTAQEVQLLAEK